MAARKVCIMGASLATGNMGVTALGTSLVKLVREADPDAEISLFIGDQSARPQVLRLNGQELRLDVINYRLSPRSDIREHLAWLFLSALFYRIAPFARWKEALLRENTRLAAIRLADFIGHIWGGDSFSDLYGMRRYMTMAAASLVVILLGKPLYLLPQTYGPYRSWLARRLARTILAGAPVALCRDPGGVDDVRGLMAAGGGGRTIRFCPDVAFALDADPPDLQAFEPPLKAGAARPLVGFNINGLMYNGGYSRNNMFGLAMDYRRFVHRAARRLLESTDCCIALIPHTFAPEGSVESDPQACREVFDALTDFGGRVHILKGEHNPVALKGIIGQCSFFVGSRMHACIAALSQGIPTVGVAYSGKFGGVFESAGAGRMVIDARETGLEEAEERLLSLYGQAEAIRPVLQERVGQMKTLLTDTFRSLIRNGSAW